MLVSATPPPSPLPDKHESPFTEQVHALVTQTSVLDVYPGLDNHDDEERVRLHPQGFQFPEQL